MDEACLFCKIVSGEIPTEKVYEDEEFLAFCDIEPQAPVHVLLIPKQHIARMTDARPQDEGLLGRMLLAANEVSQKEGIAEDGMRYVISTNAKGGQLIFHIHMHILGGREMGWPPG